MKLSALMTIATVICLASACGSSYDEDAYDAYYEEAGYYTANDSEATYEEQGTYRAQAVAQNNTGNNGDLVMHPCRNAQGQVTGYIPLPSDWKVTMQGIFGPNGTEVKDYPGHSLKGQNIHSIDDVINTYVAQDIQRNKAQTVRMMDLPQLAEADKRANSQYWKVTQMQTINQVKGIEIKQADGKLGLLVIHFMGTRSQYHSNNLYYMSVLTATPSEYERAKQIYLYGAANYTLDQQAVAAFNQGQQQRSRTAAAAHNQKMRAQQQYFNNMQKAQQNLSDINDIYYEGYKNRTAMKDAGHEKSINGIWERQKMSNPFEGGQTTVQQGYKYYYMNQNGQYFGTNNANYNPNTDPNMNHTEWRRMQNPGNGY